jgi:hypothetical protein
MGLKRREKRIAAYCTRAAWRFSGESQSRGRSGHLVAWRGTLYRRARAGSRAAPGTESCQLDETVAAEHGAGAVLLGLVCLGR